MSSTHKTPDDPMYLLLVECKIAEFNERKAQGESCALRGADLRSLDLRNLDARGLDLGDCELGHADLRGIDFSESRLDGASIYGARIADALFPRELGAEELLLSLQHGTRMRYRSG